MRGRPKIKGKRIKPKDGNFENNEFLGVGLDGRYEMTG